MNMSPPPEMCVCSRFCRNGICSLFFCIFFHSFFLSFFIPVLSPPQKIATRFPYPQRHALASSYKNHILNEMLTALTQPLQTSQPISTISSCMWDGCNIFSVRCVIKIWGFLKLEGLTPGPAAQPIQQFSFQPGCRPA